MLTVFRMPRRCYRILIINIWLALSVQASPLLDQMSAQFKRDFGIQIVADGEPYPVGGAEGTILAQNTGVNNADMVLSFLRKEFAKYPVELIRLSGVKRIVLCRELRIGSTRIAGVAVERNASIYVDSTTMVGDELHRRRTFHHEFFHFLDYSRGGDIGSNPAWMAANAPGIAYGATPPPEKPGQHRWASHPAPGFVSDYSLKALPEDRAELFAGLMTNNLTLRFMLQKDLYLATKVRLLKDELQQLCPKVDETFWTGVTKF
ncbi:MAG: hypothetical protein ABIZ04_25875 [Opitutus sp.]